MNKTKLINIAFTVDLALLIASIIGIGILCNLPFVLLLFPPVTLMAIIFVVMLPITLVVGTALAVIKALQQD